MRLILIFLLLTSVVYGQWQPINGKQRFTAGLGVPAKDTGTTSAADTSMITIRPQDSSLWIKYKGDWYKVSRNTAANPNAILNGGNSFGSTARIGTTDNNDLNIINNNTNYWTFGKTGTFKNGNVSLDFSGNITASSSSVITGGAVYPLQYLSLPDTNRNAAYGLIGTHNGSLFCQIGSGQYFRQVLMSKDSSLYITPTYFNANKGTGTITGNSPTISSSTVPFTYWNGTNHIGYTNAAVIDTVTGNITGTGAIKSAKGLLDSTSSVGIVTPTQSALKLNKSNFIDSLTGRNATLLGNTTTGTGSTIVLSGSPTLTLPNIAAINVSGGILSFPTGGSGTVALRGDTGTYFYPYSSNPKNYIGLTSLSATRNVSTGSIFTYNSATGAYNLDTTRLGGGGLTGSGTVSSSVVPFTVWSVSNSKLSSTLTNVTYDTSGLLLSIKPTKTATANNQDQTTLQVTPTFSTGGFTGTRNIALQIGTNNSSSFTSTATPNTLHLGNDISSSAGANAKLILAQGTFTGGFPYYAGIGVSTNGNNVDYISQTLHNWYTGGASPTQTMSLNQSGQLSMSSIVATGNIQLGGGNNLYFGSSSFNQFVGVTGGNVIVSSGGAIIFKFNNATNYGQMFSTGRWFFGASPSDDGVNQLQINGSIALKTAGNKINIATGTNASVGTSAAMVAGTITISTTAVTASSKIFLTNAAPAGTIGVLSVGTITAGTSFVINSSSALDTSTVNWFIIN